MRRLRIFQLADLSAFAPVPCGLWAVTLTVPLPLAHHGRACAGGSGRSSSASSERALRLSCQIRVLTDASTCKIRYIGRPADVAGIDSLLAAALSSRLAADACYTLVQSNGVQQQMWQLYGIKLDEAKGVDNVESSRDYYVNTSLENVRSGVQSSGLRFGRAWW